jgi:hypothetical protein
MRVIVMAKCARAAHELRLLFPGSLTFEITARFS